MISNAAEDERFCDHPGLSLYGIHAYVAVPLYRPDGTILGTLCGLDPDATPLSDQQVADLSLLSSLLQHELAEQERKVIRDRWLGILAHDLRTPLHNIRLLSEVMTRVGGSPNDVHERLQRNVDRMDEMIGSILTFARTQQSEGVPLHRSRVELLPFLEEQLADRFLDMEILTTDLPSPLVVDADAARLAQAFGNLFDNARNHSTDGSFKVRVDGREHRVRVSVVNKVSGPIPPNLTDLFEPFVRGTCADSEGVGLGLFLARTTLRAHGGTLDCSWTPETVTFFAELPTLQR